MASTPQITSSTTPPKRTSRIMSGTSFTTSTTAPIWAELASLTLQAFTPQLIDRLHAFIERTPSFDISTHVPLLATLVIRHVTLSLKESSAPATRSFRDVAYHAVMSNRILTKRERSIVRAVSVGRIQKDDQEGCTDPVHAEGERSEPLLKEKENLHEHVRGRSELFPRARGKDCLQSASMRRLLANQTELEVSALEAVPQRDGEVRKASSTKKRAARKRASIRYVPKNTDQTREMRCKQSIPRVCEDTSVAVEKGDGSEEKEELQGRNETLREPRVRRERPSRLVQLRRQRLERRKAPI